MINFLAASLVALAPSVHVEDPLPEHELFRNVVVTGASLSAGYGLRTELEAKSDFGTVIASALRAKNSKVTTHGSVYFFQAPVTTAEKLIGDTLAEKPSLVLALDYLFWFVFGQYATEDARVDSLKLGLRLLDRVECPLLVADFPDMRLALAGTSPFGALIREDMLPTPETLEKLNAMVHAWANERERVVAVPMGDFFRRMTSEEDVAMRGNEWLGTATGEMLQEDLLHPTLAGDIGLAVLAFDSLAAATPEFCEDCLVWKVDEIHERVLERTREEREKNRERARKRAERKKKREERKKGKDKSLAFDPIGSFCPTH